MKLYQVVLKDILRRKRRVLYAILGVVIGTMTVVGILTTATAGQAKITAQLEKYGANLSLLPAVKSVDTSTLVFGPALYGYNAFVNLQDSPDWNTVGQNYDWFIKHKGWQRQFKMMKDFGAKVEIQSLSSKGISFISEKYLPEKIKKQDWLD